MNPDKKLDNKNPVFTEEEEAADIENGISTPSTKNNSSNILTITPVGSIGYRINSRKRSSTNSSIKFNSPIEDDVILSRFYQTGILSSSRQRSRSHSQHYYAHHHLENVLTQIEKSYEIERKLKHVEDVRYKDVIEQEEARKERKRQAHLAQLEVEVLEQQQSQQQQPHHQKQQKKVAYADSIQVNTSINHNRPVLTTQLSTTSVWSVQSMQNFAFGEGKDFLIHICPVDILEWRNYSFWRKTMELIKMVPYFMLTICIPVVDLESPNENWCRLLICFNIIFGPQAIIFLTNNYDFAINDIFPLWSAVLLVSCTLAVIIFFTSNPKKPPVYHRVFGLMGFFTSVIFVKTIATEVIEVLTTLGVIFNLSDSILGLTVLAWGNSLGGKFWKIDERARKQSLLIIILYCIIIIIRSYFKSHNG